jgi:hypothetical protein
MTGLLKKKGAVSAATDPRHVQTEPVEGSKLNNRVHSTAGDVPPVFAAGIGPLATDARENMLLRGLTIAQEHGTIVITCRETNRLALATVIERLIDLLDATEPDADLEPDVDREFDPAEDGLADRDAIDSEDFYLSGLNFDGSGRRKAKRMLQAVSR